MKLRLPVLALVVVAPFAILAAVRSHHEGVDDVLTRMKRADSILIANAEAGVRARFPNAEPVQFTKVHTFHAGDTVWVCGYYNAKGASEALKPAQMFVAMRDSVVVQEGPSKVVEAYLNRWCKSPMTVRIPAATSVSK